jgi:hypothetical protein
MWLSVISLGVPRLGHTVSFQILSDSLANHSMPGARKIAGSNPDESFQPHYGPGGGTQALTEMSIGNLPGG